MRVMEMKLVNLIAWMDSKRGKWTVPVKLVFSDKYDSFTVTHTSAKLCWWLSLWELSMRRDNNCTSNDGNIFAIHDSNSNFFDHDGHNGFDSNQQNDNDNDRHYDANDFENHHSCNNFNFNNDYINCACDNDHDPILVFDDQLDAFLCCVGS